MTKTSFFADNNVKDFVNWLALKLNDTSLLHHYKMPSGKHVNFSGLEDALSKYDWPYRFLNPSTKVTHSGNTYPQNDAALAVLRTGLLTSLALAPASGRDQQTRDWAIAVMEWGGVRNGNVAWLQTNVHGLADEINAAQNILVNGDDDKSILRGTIRRFNAGMTKVYSLLVNDFIIYDSRVAAALAWLVVRWCIESGRTSVPDMLRFPCLRPKEGDNPSVRKLRNPRCDGFHFPWLYGAINHAHWNLRASWILSKALLQSSGSKFHKATNPLRALEAALFMWGYDLQHTPACNSDNFDKQENPSEEMESLTIEDESQPHEISWNKSCTRGVKAKKFAWRFDGTTDSIHIDRGLGKPDVFTAEIIFSVIHDLYDYFGNDWYLLANNVEKMGNGTEVRGLGSSIYSISKDTTQAMAASQLGVILEALGIFEWNNRTHGIAWRLRIEPPSTIDDLRMALLSEPIMSANP